MRAAVVGTDAVRHLLSAEQTRRLDNRTLGMHPFGLNRVEPRTLDGQRARQDTHAVAAALDLLVVGANPSADGFAHVPGGVIPDQDPHGHLQRRQFAAAPVQKLGRDGTDWAPLDKAQPDRFVLADTAHEQTVTGQGLGVGIGFGDRLFHQTQRAVQRCPGVQVRLGQPTPPHRVGEAQRPVGVRCRQGDQAVASAFFRAYAGSGLVIQCLARVQPMPSRCPAAAASAEWFRR